MTSSAYFLNQINKIVAFIHTKHTDTMNNALENTHCLQLQVNLLLLGKK